MKILILIIQGKEDIEGQKIFGTNFSSYFCDSLAFALNTFACKLFFKETRKGIAQQIKH